MKIYKNIKNNKKQKKHIWKSVTIYNKHKKNINFYVKDENSCKCIELYRKT